MQTTRVNNDLSMKSHKICWAAIIGGIVVTIIVSLLLNLLGMGLGLAVFSPNMESVKALTTSSLVWLFFSGIIAMFMGGWIAGAMNGTIDSVKGYWQGFIVAGVSVMLMFYLASAAAISVTGGIFGALSSLTSSAANVNKNIITVSNDSNDQNNFSKESMVEKAKDILPASMAPFIDQINYEADILSNTMGEQIADKTPSSQDVSDAAKNAKAKAEFYKKKVGPALKNFLQSIKTDNYDQARKDLTEALSQASGKSPKEIDAKINEWQKSYEDAKTKAAQVAEEAANKSAAFLSKAALINFFLLLSSIIAAGVGGICGARYLVKKSY